MALQFYLRAVAKRWKLVTLCVLAGALVALLATFTTERTYQAKSQLFVSVQSNDTDVSAANQGNTFTQQRVTSYAAIVNSPLVLDPVVTEFGLSPKEANLGANVEASVPLNTNLLDVRVTDEDPERAAAIANAVSAQFANVITDLERPKPTGESLVRVTVVKDAAVPSGPISPRPRLNLAIGLVLGLALGVALAVLREHLDTTVKQIEDIEEIAADLGRPLNVIGSIGKDSSAAKTPLIVNADPQSKRAEAFRQLRTNLQFVDVDSPPRSIVITSSLAVEGKSTTAANLAITLAQAGLRVALVEADLRRPKLAGYMGVEGAVGLTDVLVGRASAKDVMQPWGRLPLSFLPSGRPAPNPSELLGSRAMLTLLKELEASFDIVLLDAPPLLPVTDAAVMSALAGGALLIVRVGSTTRDQVEEAAEALHSVDARLLGVVLTMVPSRGRRASYDYEYTDLAGDRGARRSRAAAGAGANGSNANGTARRSAGTPSRSSRSTRT